MTEITREELISTITEAFLRAGYGQNLPPATKAPTGPQPADFDGYGPPATTGQRRPDNADAYTAYCRQIEAEKAAANKCRPTFEVGDIVSLKTGGSAMTIAAIQGDACIVIWQTECGQILRDALPLAVLTFFADETEEA